MTQSMTDKSSMDSRRGVRRTVTILVTVVLAFFALSFVQIMLMK
jgi:Tfp pilus assembly protein PilX